MTSLKHILAVVCLLCLSESQAQYSDFGIWLQGGVKQEVFKDTDWSAQFSCRLNDRATRPGNIFTDLELGHKFTKYLSLSGTYRIGVKQDQEGYFNGRQRYSLELTTDWDVGVVKFKYRFRFQSSLNGFAQAESGVEYKNGYRHKVSLETKLMKKTWLELQSELFTNNQDGALRPSDIRFKLSMQRKLKKRNYYSTGILFQTELNNGDPLREFVVFYSYDFEFKKSDWAKKKKKKKPVQDATE